jgi:hypothetical protein
MQKNNDDTQKLLLYIKLWVDALRAREKGDESTEDILLEKLDRIWFSMTDTQISLINSLSERLVNNKITLDYLEKKYFQGITIFNTNKKINRKKWSKGYKKSPKVSNV